MRKFRRSKILKRGLGVLAALIVGSVVVQLLYPSGWLPPLTHVTGHQLFLATGNDIDRIANRYENAPLRVNIAGHSYPYAPLELGIRYNPEATVHSIADYPWRQRFVPFSLLWRSVGLDYSLQLSSDETALHLTADRLARESMVEPRPARFVYDNGEVRVQNGAFGVTYSAEKISSKLRLDISLGKSSIQLNGTSQEPDFSASELKKLQPAAYDFTRQTIRINAGGSDYYPTAAELTKWLSARREKGKLALDFDQTAIEAYVQELEKQTGFKPTATKITTRDGKEVTRTPGIAGSGLAVKPTAEQILASLREGKHDVTVAFVTILPQTAFSRTYSNTQQGLQILLDELVAEKGNYGIAVRDIGERNWKASSNGARQFITASTYKLFVAYSTLKRIENGNFLWTQPVYDTTLSTCFDRMIINSDNACAEALGARIGWSTVESEAQALGLTSTFLRSNFTSRADDEAIFLTKLAKGEMLSAASRERLLDVMKRQVYRSGIPAGTKTVVADKVGFLYGLLHDAAIVYGPKQTYVLVIMTDGSSWANIADAAARINDLLQT